MNSRASEVRGRPNKVMKLTRPEPIGASQLIPGVRRLTRGARPGATSGFSGDCFRNVDLCRGSGQVAQPLGSPPAFDRLVSLASLRGT